MPASIASRKPIASIARLSMRLVGAMTSGGVRAIRSARASTSAASPSAGTTRFTSPIRSASTASTRSPVNSSSRVFFWPTRYGMRSATGAEP